MYTELQHHYKLVLVLKYIGSLHIPKHNPIAFYPRQTDCQCANSTQIHQIDGNRSYAPIVTQVTHHLVSPRLPSIHLNHPKRATATPLRVSRREGTYPRDPNKIQRRLGEHQKFVRKASEYPYRPLYGSFGSRLVPEYIYLSRANEGSFPNVHLSTF